MEPLQSASRPLSDRVLLAAWPQTFWSPTVDVALELQTVYEGRLAWTPLQPVLLEQPALIMLLPVARPLFTAPDLP